MTLPKLNIADPWRSLFIAILAAVITLLGGTTATQVRGGGCYSPPPPVIVPPPPPTVPAPPATKPDPEPAPPPKPEPTKEPIRAVVRVIMSGGYCSGTIVGAPRKDGTVTIVTAAHCLRAVGERVTLHTLHDTGNTRSFAATAIAIDRTADAAILVSESPQPGLPWLPLATETPEVNTAIWHAGFGQDQPGNVEKGRVLAKPNRDGQTQYWLSVSPGDSGGGIMLDSQGRLLSPVCCTTNLAAPGNVWGAAPEVLQRMLSAPASFVGDLQPVAMPTPRHMSEAIEPKK